MHIIIINNQILRRIYVHTQRSHIQDFCLCMMAVYKLNLVHSSPVSALRFDQLLIVPPNGLPTCSPHMVCDSSLHPSQFRLSVNSQWWIGVYSPQLSCYTKLHKMLHFEQKKFCLSRQKAEIFRIFMILNFVKPHKISFIYLDKQKSFVPKKDTRIAQFHCN